MRRTKRRYCYFSVYFVCTLDLLVHPLCSFISEYVFAYSCLWHKLQKPIFMNFLQLQLQFEYIAIKNRLMLYAGPSSVTQQYLAIRRTARGTSWRQWVKSGCADVT